MLQAESPAVIGSRGVFNPLPGTTEDVSPEVYGCQVGSEGASMWGHRGDMTAVWTDVILW